MKVLFEVLNAIEVLENIQKELWTYFLSIK